MNKKISSLGLILAAALVGFAACDDDEEIDYHWATVESGSGSGTAVNQVYFPNSLPSTVNLDATATSYDIAVCRIDTTSAIAVPLTVTGDSGEVIVPAHIIVPDTLHFAAGSKEAAITLTYDPDLLGFDNFQTFTITIGDEYTTPYGVAAYTVTVGIPAPWISLGMATFTEDFMTTFFSSVSNVPYAVEIQENQLYPGYFRLVNPFCAAYPYNEEGDWDDSQDWYIEIHAEDATAVYMYTQATGMDWGYGMVSVSSFAGFYMARGNSLEDVKAEGYTGTYADGIITFPAEALLVSMAGYNDGALYYANLNGAFMVAMPGVVLRDYSVAVAYAGKYYDVDDQPYAVGDVELGEDVASAKAVVVAGRSNEEDGIAAILEGTDEGIVEFATSGEVRVPMPADAATGPYTIVVVTYDSEGTAQKSDYATFSYTASGEVAETWTAAYIGTFAYKFMFCNDDGSPYYDEGLTLYASDQVDGHYKIANVFYGVDFIFTLNADGTITFEDQYTGYTSATNGDVYVQDMHVIAPSQFPTPNYYSDGVFYFNIGYHCAAGYYGFDKSENNDNLETFTLTGVATEADGKPAPRRDAAFHFDGKLISGKFLRSKPVAAQLAK